MTSTEPHSTGFHGCALALDSVTGQTVGWQPASCSLTWPPPWPPSNVINIPNQWRKQSGSGQGCEHDLLLGFKQPVILCLHLIFTLFLWRAKRQREVSWFKPDYVFLSNSSSAPENCLNICHCCHFACCWCKYIYFFSLLVFTFAARQPHINK